MPRRCGAGNAFGFVLGAAVCAVIDGLRGGMSKEPRVEEVGVSAIDGDLILGVMLAGEAALGEVMVAILLVGWVS